MKISYLNSATDQHPSAIDFHEAMRLVQQDQAIKDRTAHIRRMIANCEDHTEIAAVKRGLPAIMPSGVFAHRGDSGLAIPSGLLCADLDDLDDLDAAWGKVNADQHCLAAFRSPSGRGIKAFYLAPQGSPSHWASWWSMREHLEAQGLSIDPSTSNVERLCFLGHDPTPFYTTLPTLSLPLASVIPERKSEEAKPAQVNGKYRHPHRHAYLTSIAGSLRFAGLHGDTLNAALQSINKERCEPPKPEHEVADIARWADSKEGIIVEDTVAGEQIVAGLLSGSEQVAVDATEEPQGIKWYNHEDHLRDLMEDQEDLIEGLLPMGGIGAIIAAPGVGKTLMAVALCESFGSTGMFAKRKTMKGRVLYLATDARQSTHRRLAVIDPAATPLIESSDQIKLPRDFEALAQRVDYWEDAGQPVRLIVVDTWDSTREHSTGGYTEVDKQLNELLAVLRTIADKANLGVIVLHHATRGDEARARGSIVFDAKCDWIALVKDEDGNPEVKELESVKVRDGEKGRVGTWKVESYAVPNHPKNRKVPRVKYLEQADTSALLDDGGDKKVLKALLAGKRSKGEIAEYCKIPEGSVFRKIKTLKEEGYIDDSNNPTVKAMAMFADTF